MYFIYIIVSAVVVLLGFVTNNLAYLIILSTHMRHVRDIFTMYNGFLTNDEMGTVIYICNYLTET